MKRFPTIFGGAKQRPWRRTWAGKPGLITDPTAVAAWLAYYEAEDLYSAGDGGATRIGQTATGPPKVAPWPCSSIASGGSNFDLAGNSSTTPTRYMEIEAASGGPLGPADYWGKASGTTGSATIGLSDPELAALHACATGSLAFFGRIGALGDSRLCGASSRYTNRWAMMGFTATGRLYFELNYPQGSAGGAEFWQSTTGVVTTGYHSLIVSQTGTGSPGEIMIGYVDGEPVAMTFDGTAPSVSDETHWIADVDNTTSAPRTFCIGARIDWDNPYTITFGADADFLEAGLTADGNVISASGAAALSAYQFNKYGV